MAKYDEFHEHMEYQEHHDTYREFSLASARLLGKFSHSTSKKTITTALTPVILTAAAAGLAVFLCLPFFNTKLESVTETSAELSIYASFGTSDYDLPMSYELYELDGINYMLDGNGNIVHTDIARDPRPAEEKYSAGASVEKGTLTKRSAYLKFSDLNANTRYLFLLFDDEPNGELKDALDELVFSTSATKKDAGGALDNALPVTTPLLSPAPSPSPSPSPSPTPTRAPYIPPAPTPAPTPPTEYREMNIEVIADMEGESTPAGDTSLVYTHLLFDVRNSAITSLTYGSSASISKTTDRVIVTVDPDSANPRVLNYSPTITSGGSGTFSISGVATTWALSPGDHTVSATVEYLSSAGGLVNVAAPPATFTVTETPNPAMSFVGTPTTSITSNGDGSSRIHVYYTVDLSGFNITQLTPGAMGEQQNIGSIATSIDGAPANWTETTAHTPGTTYGNTDFEFYVDVPDPAPATYQTSMLLDYKYNYSFHGEIIERAGSSSIDNTF